MWPALSWNIILSGESVEEVIEKYGKWKKVVERKDLTMNVQTKDKQLLDGNRV